MRNKRVIISILATICIVGSLLATKVSFYNRSGFEGIYLLKGFENDWFAITDDLYPVESPHLIWGMALPKLKRAKTSSQGACRTGDKPCTYFEWNEGTGRGFIKTLFPDATKLVIAFGRFVSSNGRDVNGLFIGGGLPASDPDYQRNNNSETGMTYFDGQRWYHIWCNVNEGIQDSTGNKMIPSTWRFISSKILENSARSLTIQSNHQTFADGVPVQIERTMFYTTGDMFVTLTTKVTNIGNRPATLMYIYGDEPWIGDYERHSRGNIGWYAGGLVFTESLIDTEHNNFIGMYDYGNPLIGEPRSTVNKANFLEWDPGLRPDIAYFSNQFAMVAPPEKRVPLASENMRVLSLQWGPKTLAPGQTFSFPLNVGMAPIDKKSGLPTLPDTHRQ